MPSMTPNPTFVDLLETVYTQPGLLHEAFTRFHNYSLGNQMLALVQCQQRGLEPGPLATYATWQTLGRQVRKGAKALVLCQPVTMRRTVDDVETPDAGDEVTFTKFIYRPRWFVLAQTDGQPFAPPAPPTWNKAQALKSLGITEVPFDHLDGNCQGFARGRSVAVSPIAVNPFETLVHEMAHVLLGHTGAGEMTTEGRRMPRNVREVEAESVALLVLGALGEPGLEFPRGYIQFWLKDGQITERSAQRIFKTADAILRAGRADCELMAIETMAA